MRDMTGKKDEKTKPSLHPSQSLHPKVQHQSQELRVMVGGYQLLEIKEF